MARRLSLLTRGHHLRREPRDPAQHHRASRPRLRHRNVMDDDDRRLFEDGLRKATETQSGPALDAALTDLGWHDAFTDDRMVAVSTLFRLQGAANATSSALDDVLLHALGLELDTGTAVLLPPAGE